MNLEQIYINNREHVAKYIQLKINELEIKQENEKDLDKVTTNDTIDLFKQAKEVILKSNIR